MAECDGSDSPLLLSQKAWQFQIRGKGVLNSVGTHMSLCRTWAFSEASPVQQPSPLPRPPDTKHINGCISDADSGEKELSEKKTLKQQDNWLLPLAKPNTICTCDAPDPQTLQVVLPVSAEWTDKLLPGIQVE